MEVGYGGAVRHGGTVGHGEAMGYGGVVWYDRNAFVISIIPAPSMEAMEKRKNVF